MEQIELVGEEFWVGEFEMGELGHYPTRIQWYVDWLDDNQEYHQVLPENIYCSAPVYLKKGALAGTGKVIQMGDTVYITDISTNANRQQPSQDVSAVSGGVDGTLSIPDRTQGEISSSRVRDEDASVTGTETQTPTGSGHPGIPCAE